MSWTAASDRDPSTVASAAATSDQDMSAASDPEAPRGTQPTVWSRAWWSGVTPLPTPRAAGLVAVGAVISAVGPDTIGVLLPLLVVAVLVIVDARSAPAPGRVGVARSLPAVLPLDGEGIVVWRLSNPTRRGLRASVADSFAPSLGASSRRFQTVLPPSGRGRIETPLRPRRRGTFRPTELTVRTYGRFGLAARQAARSLPGRIEIHPSFRSREAAELRIRRARILDEGVRSVRARGGGTEFEALREYVQGDEFRHVDWSATARAGVPIVRTYRAERNQTVVVLLDTGRVVAGLVDEVPRLDHGMDATLALATVATHLGDRVGLIAFGGEVQAIVPPRRQRDQLRRISQAMHALEPELAESGYRDAFRTTLARFRRRALLVVITELAAESVQETLLPALPLVTREHAVVVASVQDPAVRSLHDRPVRSASDAYGAAAAAAVLEERNRAAARLRAAGAHVLDAPPDQLASSLADLYLDVKARGGL